MDGCMLQLALSVGGTERQMDGKTREKERLGAWAGARDVTRCAEGEWERGGGGFGASAVCTSRGTGRGVAGWLVAMPYHAAVSFSTAHIAALLPITHTLLLSHAGWCRSYREAPGLPVEEGWAEDTSERHGREAPASGTR